MERDHAYSTDCGCVACSNLRFYATGCVTPAVVALEPVDFTQTPAEQPPGDVIYVDFVARRRVA